MKRKEKNHKVQNKMQSSHNRQQPVKSTGIGFNTQQSCVNPMTNL